MAGTWGLRGKNVQTPGAGGKNARGRGKGRGKREEDKENKSVWFAYNCQLRSQ